LFPRLLHHAPSNVDRASAASGGPRLRFGETALKVAEVPMLVSRFLSPSYLFLEP
jgi:hypothetical protein